MAAIQYKPTRMELSNLKKRLKTAVRGHKMMKDKRDELVRRFIVLARKSKELREQTEAKMAAAMQNFVLAKATMSNNEIEEALLYPARGIQVDAEKQTILSIRKKYGKNAIVKGMNLQEAGTAMDRNQQVGGHKA